MQISEMPYQIIGTQKVSATGTSQEIDFKGKTATMQNLGPNSIFISNTTATTNDFKLVIDDSITPLTGKVNVISDGTADVRILYIDPFGM